MANQKSSHKTGSSQPSRYSSSSSTRRTSYSERYNRPNPYSGYMPPGVASSDKVYHPEAIDPARVRQLQQEQEQERLHQLEERKKAEERHRQAEERKKQQAEERRRQAQSRPAPVETQSAPVAPAAPVEQPVRAAAAAPAVTVPAPSRPRGNTRRAARRENLASSTAANRAASEERQAHLKEIEYAAAMESAKRSAIEDIQRAAAEEALRFREEFKRPEEPPKPEPVKEPEPVKAPEPAPAPEEKPAAPEKPKRDTVGSITLTRKNAHKKSGPLRWSSPVDNRKNAGKAAAAAVGTAAVAAVIAADDNDKKKENDVPEELKSAEIAVEVPEIKEEPAAVEESAVVEEPEIEVPEIEAEPEVTEEETEPEIEEIPAEVEEPVVEEFEEPDDGFDDDFVTEDEEDEDDVPAVIEPQRSSFEDALYDTDRAFDDEPFEDDEIPLIMPFAAEVTAPTPTPEPEITIDVPETAEVEPEEDEPYDDGFDDDMPEEDDFDDFDEDEDEDDTAVFPAPVQPEPIPEPEPEPEPVPEPIEEISEEEPEEDDTVPYEPEPEPEPEEEPEEDEDEEEEDVRVYEPAEKKVDDVPDDEPVLIAPKPAKRNFETRISADLAAPDYDPGVAQDETLFIRKRHPEAATAVFAATTPGLAPELDDDDFFEQWLEEGEDMIVKDKRQRRRVSALIGGLTMVLAIVGFIYIVSQLVSSCAAKSSTADTKSTYSTFILPVVNADPEPFETLSATDANILVEAAINRLTYGEAATEHDYEMADVEGETRIQIPAADVMASGQVLFGPDFTVSLDAMYSIEDEKMYYYSAADGYFHVSTGGSDIDPVILKVSRVGSGKQIVLDVGYVTADIDTKDDDEYYKQMQYILNITEDSYYISAVRALEE